MGMLCAEGTVFDDYLHTILPKIPSTYKLIDQRLLTQTGNIVSFLWSILVVGNSYLNKFLVLELTDFLLRWGGVIYRISPLSL